MLIRMYEHKALMDAGRERTFSPGVQYEVSPVLGSQWVASGCAVAVVEEPPSAQPVTRAAKGKARP